MSFIPMAAAGLAGGLLTKGGRKALFGQGESFKQKSRLDQQQQPLYAQLQQAAMGSGAGGAFGQSSDYFRDLLSDDSQTAEMMARPEMRRFREDIIPGLAEQFAGMGSGGLTSSGFRNAAINAGTDLSERLGAIRAQLRSQGAAGLAGIGQQGLGDYTNNIFRPQTTGLLGGLAQGAGKGLGQAAGAYMMGGA